MFFAWSGLFEQMAMADVFVHYDDVQLPQGRSFITRVQVKTSTGVRWLSAPVERSSRGPINQVRLDQRTPWRQHHIVTLRTALAAAPHVETAVRLAEGLLHDHGTSLCSLNVAATESIAAEFGLAPRFLRSSALAIPGHSSERLVAIVQSLGGTVYLTGHGAANYLNHELFERAGLEVRYVRYGLRPYPQLHGEFTPFVTALDLIANMGRAANTVLDADSVNWREFRPPG